MPDHTKSESRGCCQEQGFSRTGLRRFLYCTRRQPRLLAGALALMLTAAALSLAGPRLLGYVIDRALLEKDLRLLALLTGLFLAVESLRALATAGHGYLYTKLGQSIMQDLRLELYEHLQKLPLKTFTSVPAGSLLTRLTSDVAALEQMFNSNFMQIFGDMLVVIGILVAVFLLNVKLAALTLCLFPLFFLVAFRIGGKLYRAHQNVRRTLSALNGCVAESIAGMRVIALFNRQRAQARVIAEHNNNTAAAQLHRLQMNGWLHCSITMVNAFGMAALIYYGGLMVERGEIKIGVLVTFSSYVLWLFWPILQALNRWDTLLAGLVALDRIFDLLSWQVEEDVGPVTSRPRLPETRPRGHIVFDRVSFAYRPGVWVLDDFSLEIKPGEKLGVVGPTGSGKTTLIRLLVRFYDPGRGVIYLDGRRLDSYDKRALRRMLGLVEQEAFFFSDSIRDNICLWEPEDFDRFAATGAARDLLAALRAVDTRLAERGANLSLGQRQLLSFLRTLRSNPAVWILDEAAAHLSPQLDFELSAHVVAHSAGSTIITIAHRLSSVSGADRIAVLYHGKLRELGTQAELLAQDGFYARLFRAQSALLEN